MTCQIYFFECQLNFVDDGAVRIWRNFESEEPGKELVTAFQAITDMLPLQKGKTIGLHINEIIFFMLF